MLIREVLRQHILENWPLGVGDQALDTMVIERRLHFIRTAARTHELKPKKLRRILIDTGFILETDAADVDVIFNVTAAQELLEQASGSAAFTGAKRRFGMTLDTHRRFPRP